MSSVQMPADEFIKRAVTIAVYYGFRPADVLKNEASIERQKKVKPSMLRKPSEPRSSFDDHTGELHSALLTYVSNGMSALPQPVMFYHSNLDRMRKGAKVSKTKGPVYLGLQVIGSKKSIAEAMVIKAAFDILSEAGANVQVHLNTIGDKESVSRYSKELASYLRKNIEDIPAHARNILKKNPIQALAILFDKEHPVAMGAPRSLEFLTEKSRSHLKEVLEYLETVGIMYEIDNSVLGSGECHSQTLFELRERVEDDDETTERIVYARGCRYDEFSKRLFRLNVPAAGVVIECREESKKAKKALLPSRMRNPKVYLIQFGFEARLKSLLVCDILRKSRIPFQQSLGSEKLLGQLQWAERIGIPYTIIMGQKEALEGTVIVRNMNTRSQDTILLDKLPTYLRQVT